MPKQPIQEIFSQGLVTSRPSHMLSSGEVTRADHCVYRENNVALQRAPDHGYYSPSSPAILGTNTITGILMGNFDAEEYPDQLICRAGDDLFSSSITGASNNTFEPITSPGRTAGTFGTTPTVTGNTTATNVILYPAVANSFDGVAFVGRAIWSDVAFPLGQGTIITSVTESSGHITSVTVNIPAAATITGELIHFAPKCTLANTLVYHESIGFAVQPVDTEVLTTSAYITSCRNVTGATNEYQVRPPVATATAFNLYAIVGRTVTVEDSNVTASGTFKLAPKSVLYNGAVRVETAKIVRVDITAGNVTKIYLDMKVTPHTTNDSDLIVRFLGYASSLAITAVDGLVEELNNNTPVYSSCYFDWFPAPGTYILVFSGGIARSFADENGVSFDGLSWDGTMFLWDGQNTTRRLEYRARKSFDATNLLPRAIVARPAGLLPVIESPTVVVGKRETDEEKALGVWNAKLPNGIYWLLITEAYIPTKNQLDAVFNPLLAGDLLESAYLASNDITGESTGGGLISSGVVDPAKSPIVADASGHAGRPIPFNISDNTKNYVTITLPAPRNNGTNGYLATHWCVYIAGAGDSYLTPPPFSSFTRTHCESISTYAAGQIIELKDKQMSKTWANAGASNSPVSVVGFESYTWQMGTIQNSQSVYWHSTCGEAARGQPGFWAHGDWVLDNVQAGAYQGKAISGIKVSVIPWFQQGRPWFSVCVGTASSVNYKEDAIRCPYAGAVKTVGGPSDMWNLPPESDWGTLRVRIIKQTEADPHVLELFAPVVTVYYTTTTVNFNGPAYRCVTYRSQVGAADISDPSTLPPPRATMGDTFQGSLVLNDVTNPSFIRYSLPDQPERFPHPYRMKMGTKRKGKITALKAFKQVLIVGMERAIKRVNYLPKETDTDFSQGGGLSHEDISATHGIVGPNAITDFDMPGMGPMIAYVSTIGLRMTNGADSRALNTDVLLKDYIHPDHWGKCILKAFPNQKWLVLYYVPKDSTHGVISKCFFYSYSEDHIKGGTTIVLSGNPALTGPLPVTGPCDCFVTDACDIIINSSPQVATTDGNFIFIEDSSEDWGPIQTVTGPDDATKVNRINVPYIKTRDIFPAGFTQEANIGSVYLMHETKGNQYVVPGTTSTQGSTTLTFNSGWGANPLKIGQRVIHGGWDSPPSVLSLDDEDGTTITVSAPAVRAFTGSATFDTGVVLVRVNAAQFSEDEVPILTEYRSTSVGVGQPFLMDATANRFSMEVIKTENPNTGDLNDLSEDMSIIGIVYHASSSGETNLHAN